MHATSSEWLAPPPRLPSLCRYRHYQQVTRISEVLRSARHEAGVVSPSVSTLERVLHAAGLRLEIGTSPTTTSDLSGDRAAKLRHHRADIMRLARDAGAGNVRVFGSVARGEDDATSDIDLVVDFDIAKGLMPIVALKQQLEELLGERVDLAPMALLKPAIAARAQAEGVPL